MRLTASKNWTTENINENPRCHQAMLKAGKGVLPPYYIAKQWEYILKYNIAYI